MSEPNEPSAAPSPSEDEPEFGPQSGDPHPDRWNKHKMVCFLRELAATHSVTVAARSVGMSRQSAYRMRARLKGEPFDIAWEAAFQHGYDALHQAALERALHGVEVPVFHDGVQVGSYTRYDERLTCFLLSARNANGAQKLGRYGAAVEFWSERWDRLLDRVATGPAMWTFGPEVNLPDESEVIKNLIGKHHLDTPVRRAGR